MSANVTPFIKTQIITLNLTDAQLDNLALKPDKNGFYRVPAGALNYPNDVGDIYSGKNALKLFGPGSDFEKEIMGGYVSAETEHPKREANMTDDDWFNRVHFIDSSKTCCLIGGIELIETDRKHPGCSDNIIEIFILVKPHGNYKDQLKDKLEDAHHNVAFSIRCITADFVLPNKTLLKFITRVITFDQVNKPGIGVANKLVSVGIEAIKVTSKLLDKVKNNTTLKALGFESAKESIDKSVKLCNKELSGDSSSGLSNAYKW